MYSSQMKMDLYVLIVISLMKFKKEIVSIKVQVSKVEILTRKFQVLGLDLKKKTRKRMKKANYKRKIVLTH